MTLDTIKDRLQAARALIDQPEKWTQLAFWRDSIGRPQNSQPEPNDIACRCASGAIEEVCLFGESLKVKNFLVDSIYLHTPATDRAEGGYLGITSWNDDPERTHGQVMLAFDRAIEDA